MTKNKYDRIQIRLNPSKNYLDAMLSSALRRCPISVPALIRALLIKYLVEQQGGLGLTPSEQNDIAAIHPKSANRDFKQKSTINVTPDDTSAKTPIETNSTALEKTLNNEASAAEPSEATISVKPAHQWSANNLPPCMDMSDFNPALIIKVDGKERL